MKNDEEWSNKLSKLYYYIKILIINNFKSIIKYNIMFFNKLVYSILLLSMRLEYRINLHIAYHLKVIKYILEIIIISIYLYHYKKVF